MPSLCFKSDSIIEDKGLLDQAFIIFKSILKSPTIKQCGPWRRDFSLNVNKFILLLIASLFIQCADGFIFTMLIYSFWLSKYILFLSPPEALSLFLFLVPPQDVALHRQSGDGDVWPDRNVQLKY